MDSSKKGATTAPTKTSKESAVSGKKGETVEKSFATEVLDAHNKYRLRHGAPPVTLCSELSSWSQNYAAHLASNEQMVHRENNPYGQNIFYSWSSNAADEVSPSACVRSWYDEEKDYKYYGKEPPLEDIAKVGHFTQLIWKDTKEIGVGRAKSKQGAWYVVVDYSPKGNWINEFTANVLPLKAEQERSDTSITDATSKSGTAGVNSRDWPGPDLFPKVPKESKHNITTLPPAASNSRSSLVKKSSTGFDTSKKSSTTTEPSKKKSADAAAVIVPVKKSSEAPAKKTSAPPSSTDTSAAKKASAPPSSTDTSAAKKGSDPAPVQKKSSVVSDTPAKTDTSKKASEMVAKKTASGKLEGLLSAQKLINREIERESVDASEASSVDATKSGSIGSKKGSSDKLAPAARKSADKFAPSGKTSDKLTPAPKKSSDKFLPTKKSAEQVAPVAKQSTDAVAPSKKSADKAPAAKKGSDTITPTKKSADKLTPVSTATSVDQVVKKAEAPQTTGKQKVAVGDDASKKAAAEPVKSADAAKKAAEPAKSADAAKKAAEPAKSADAAKKAAEPAKKGADAPKKSAESDQKKAAKKASALTSKKSTVSKKAPSSQAIKQSPSSAKKAAAGDPAAKKGDAKKGDASKKGDSSAKVAAPKKASSPSGKTSAPAAAKQSTTGSSGSSQASKKSSGKGPAKAGKRGGEAAESITESRQMSCFGSKPKTTPSAVEHEKSATRGGKQEPVVAAPAAADNNAVLNNPLKPTSEPDTQRQLSERNYYIVPLEKTATKQPESRESQPSKPAEKSPSARKFESKPAESKPSENLKPVTSQPLKSAPARKPEVNQQQPVAQKAPAPTPQKQEAPQQKKTESETAPKDLVSSTGSVSELVKRYDTLPAVANVREQKSPPAKQNWGKTSHTNTAGQGQLVEVSHGPNSANRTLRFDEERLEVVAGTLIVRRVGSSTTNIVQATDSSGLVVNRIPNSETETQKKPSSQ